MNNKNDPVQHDGEFVLTCDGSKDFGEISPEIARKIRRQAGKIRLRIGEQDIQTGKGYGEAHIERRERLKQIRGIGFSTARDFVEFVAHNYDSIYEAGSSALHLYHRGEHDTLLVMKLEPAEHGDYYDVKTGYITRKNSKANKKPLWERTQGGLTSE